MRLSLRLPGITAVILCQFWLPAAALSQTIVDEVVVTGSYIERDLARSGSPVTVVSAKDLDAYGLSGISDVVKMLPFNTGSEFNADVFTQNLSTGTSNFNLRGLGLNSTLVLLNGRRQTVSGGVADDGSAFVDINALVPLSAVGRIEILKDGAAALYGTDAVAGVVNVITRSDVDGWELGADFGTTTRSSQEDVTLRALHGMQTERMNTMLSLSYLHRSWLSAPEREFTQGKGLSSFGQPGAFTLSAPSPSFPNLPSGLDEPQSVIDPNCGVTGGVPNETAPGSGLGTCTFDFSPFYQLVPRERRWLGFAAMGVDLGGAEVFAEAGYARTSVLRGTSPSFPILNLATVPANNPGNVFQTPVLFLGRPLGADAPVNLARHRSETWRATGGVRGMWRDAWNWEVSTGYSANSHVVRITNALADRFDAALNGQGGPNNNLFFNPFGSAASAQPGDATFNDPAVIDNFLSVATYDYETSLFTVDGRISGALIETESGPISAAVGGQLRQEEITGDLDDQFNAENYLFFIGGPDFAGDRTVAAVFGEVNIPVSNTLSVQLAARYEAYENGPDSADPKIAFSWRPIDWLRSRASFGTAFRTPSVFQQFSSQTVLQNIIDPITDSIVFRGVRTVGADDLKPERADVFNMGATFLPLPGLTLDIDYWRFDYQDIIVKESAQAIIDANPFDPKIIREAGQILRIDTSYINAPAVTTDGIDLKGLYTFESKNGDSFKLSADVTYISKYVIQTVPGGPKQDVSGSRNFRTFARSLPKWRSTLGGQWSRDALAASVFVRTISGYEDDQRDTPVDHHITVDTQLRYDVSNFGKFEQGLVLALGVINVFDQYPPDVGTTVGYDSKVHDPRGRVIYLRVQSAF